MLFEGLLLHFIFVVIKSFFKRHLVYYFGRKTILNIILNVRDETYNKHISNIKVKVKKTQMLEV